MTGDGGGRTDRLGAVFPPTARGPLLRTRRSHRYWSLPAVLAFSLSGVAHSGVRVDIEGLDAPLRAAVESGLSLSAWRDRSVSAAQARRLYARAPGEVRKALQPYGYYDAETTGAIAAEGVDFRVTLKVAPGAPVVVTAVDVALGPDAAALASVRRARKALEDMRGKPLQDANYDAARDALGAALTASGFLDARLLTHRVEVTRATHSAAIHLAWDSGPRYRYGKVTFAGSQLGPDALDRYVPWKPGDPFEQGQLIALQQALTAADYFAVVNVAPVAEHARAGVVDVHVTLTPAKRTIYTGGPFIGTDTGFGARAGVERRWVNHDGDKWKSELVLAQRLTTLSTLYTMPLPGDDQRAFNFGANFRDADTKTSQSRTLELVGNESRLWHGWTRTVGVHVLAGTFTVGKLRGEPDDAPGVEHGRSTLVFAEATLSRKQADSLDFVHRGWSLVLAARSSAGGLLSDAGFSQVTADANWIRAFGARQRDRIVVRGSFGTTWTDDFRALPPQLRFFAGGDRSVRGYGFQSIGPRNAAGRVIGGESLLVASATLEHYFTRSWGVAAFVDAGNAFTNVRYSPQIGSGLGLRWRSPVGMIRLDLGTPVASRDAHGIRLHLVIGPDL